MFSTTLRDGLYRDSTGFADARMDVRALSVAMMPALAMETVCCSIASWRMARVVPDILSNSSMQQMPRSDNTNAPDSMTNSLVSGSLTTDAVKPTADDPFPEVYTPLGDSLWTYPNSCDLDVPGSPTSRILMSPRLFNFKLPPSSSSSSSSNSGSSSISSFMPSCIILSLLASRAFCRFFFLNAVPFFTLREFPPNSMQSTPFLTSSISQMEGANACTSRSYTSGCLESASSSAILSGEKREPWVTSSPRRPFPVGC
mmetsp:Transcript_27161/g.58201  ORF Transcript_27161/g.58201 Transcript_27161/m.58201 type:complete len:257 (-) Transcript_27161:3855-4625(-)